jgi:hypothetical protein
LTVSHYEKQTVHEAACFYILVGKNLMLGQITREECAEVAHGIYFAEEFNEMSYHCHRTEQLFYRKTKKKEKKDCVRIKQFCPLRLFYLILQLYHSRRNLQVD